MLNIYVADVSAPSVLAAEELKKYIKMLMPDVAEPTVVYADGTDGIRICLMDRLGLDLSDVTDYVIDDVLYADFAVARGVIAGSNPRSILLSCYEFLRRQGVRWLFPGIDGEYVPIINQLLPVSFRHKPSMRYRGPISEGGISQRSLKDLIEFLPRVGMNHFMMEFRIPTSYYRRYYNHFYNSERQPEPVSNNTILQWRRECEAEAARRGLIFGGVGHGWCVDALGISSSLRNEDGDNELAVPAESREYLALINGERKLVFNTPNYTNICISSAVARRMVVNEIVDYAKKNLSTDFLHVYLGDSLNKQCECEKCAVRTPSDWFVILLNELDEELEREGLSTRIAFIAYIETLFAPKTETIKNSNRFLLFVCPITRRYTESVPTELTPPPVFNYECNKVKMPSSVNDNLAYFLEWKRAFSGDMAAFEYHFWRHQYLDVSGIRLARILYNDNLGYKKLGLSGICQNGSVRSFFPTGFAFYLHARSMFDTSLSFDGILQEYFSCAFGNRWQHVADYLERIAEAFSMEYLEGERSDAPEDCLYYAPTHVESLKSTKQMIEHARKLINESKGAASSRIESYSWRLLDFHADYLDMLGDVMIAKAAGDDDAADVRYNKMCKAMGEREVYFEGCYDHALLFYTFSTVINKRTTKSEPIIY